MVETAGGGEILQVIVDREVSQISHRRQRFRRLPSTTQRRRQNGMLAACRAIF
jgi:hypothetical protein